MQKYTHGVSPTATASYPPTCSQTQRAAKRVNDLLAGKDKAGVRLGVRRRGCNGLSYTMDYADEKPKGDEVVVKDGKSMSLDSSFFNFSSAQTHMRLYATCRRDSVCRPKGSHARHWD